MHQLVSRLAVQPLLSGIRVGQSIRAFALSLPLVVGPTVVGAQTGTVTGRVSDASSAAPVATR